MRHHISAADRLTLARADLDYLYSDPDASADDIAAAQLRVALLEAGALLFDRDKAGLN